METNTNEKQKKKYGRGMNQQVTNQHQQKDNV